MGYAIASAALEQGHDVVLISGPVCLDPPPAARTVSAITAEAMCKAVQTATRGCDVLVMCAAVADYKAARVAAQKIKKRDEPFSIELVQTCDILQSLPSSRDYFIVGFAAETNNLEKNAREKLRHKNCDMVVANDVSDPSLGFESDNNEVTIFCRNGAIKKISRAPKAAIARQLVKIILENIQKGFDKKNTRMNDSCT